MTIPLVALLLATASSSIDGPNSAPLQTGESEAAPAVAVPAPEAEPPPPLWELYVGAIGGMRVDQKGGGGGVMVGVNRKFLGFVRPELMVATTLYDAPFDYLILIRIGARFELPNSTRWKPYLSVAFAHNHESPVHMIGHDPLGHLFGLSNSGVHHRSGLEGGIGVAYEVPRLTPWKIATRVGARLTFTQFVGDPFPPRYVDLTMTAGVCL